jgi:predicted nucleic acid-binding protein
MSLIAQEIKELREMVKLYDGEKITTEQVRTKLNIYKETHKRAKLILDICIAAHRPKNIVNTLHDLNLLSKGETVQVNAEIELEMIQCPDMSDKLISRAECLSYSGESKNNESCSTCKNFNITRRLLLTTSAA